MKIMIGLRVTEDFKSSLQKFADEENRTLSNFIENALLAYIRDHKGVDLKKRSKTRKARE
jgi:hypothetical protein